MLLASRDKLYLCNLNAFAMARPFHLLIYSLLMVALFSCNRPEDKAIALRLAQWDAVLDEDPGAIKDSLALQ